MAKIEWQDTTNHYRGEIDRTPREWTAKIGGLAVVVHRHVHYNADEWLFSTRPRVFEAVLLGAVSADHAKQRAIETVAAWLEMNLAAFKEASYDDA